MINRSRPVLRYEFNPHSADSEQLTQNVPSEPSPAQMLARLGPILPSILADNPILIQLAMQANPAMLELVRPKTASD